MSAKPRLLVTRRLPAAVEERLCARFDATLNPEDQPLDGAALTAAFRDYDALCPTITDRFDPAWFEAGSRVRILANFGAGIEHIPLEAARAAGIAVTNTPDALTDATAEIAILLMLMAARRASEGEAELRGGRWTGWRPTHLMGRGLAGKTLGLIGFGRIAQACAERAAALGMAIRYYSRRDNGDPRRAPTIEALVGEADIVSLHVPGGAKTRHLVDAALLAAMRPGAILINTARGSIVDEAALADALDSGQVGAAGLDVYEREPLVHPRLLACRTAVLLPHLGSATIEARTAMGMQAAGNLEAFFAGREPPNRVA